LTSEDVVGLRSVPPRREAWAVRDEPWAPGPTVRNAGVSADKAGRFEKWLRRCEPSMSCESVLPVERRGQFEMSLDRKVRRFERRALSADRQTRSKSSTGGASRRWVTNPCPRVARRGRFEMSPWSRGWGFECGPCPSQAGLVRNCGPAPSQGVAGPSGSPQHVERRERHLEDRGPQCAVIVHGGARRPRLAVR
jgi:hypothetical protein